MRRLLVLRHAKAARPAGVADRDRPLADRGRDQCARVGRLLAADGLMPDRVVLSPALRTRETATRVLEAAGSDLEGETDERLYDASGATVLAVLGEAGAGTTLVVGHNPGLHEAVLQLAGGDATTALRRGFPTASLAVFEGEAGAERLARFVAASDGED